MVRSSGGSVPVTGDQVRAAMKKIPEHGTLLTALFAGMADMLQPPEQIDSQWLTIAHDFQKPPEGDWNIWLLVAGRGSGKTRAAAEWVTDRIFSGKGRYIELVGPTASDVRDVMVEGPAGLLRVAEARGIRCQYLPSKRRVVWPDYGATATMFSAEEPRRLRGPQGDTIWFEELAAFQDAWLGDAEETTWNNAMFGLRLGPDPKAVGTTTPKVNKLTRTLIERTTDPEAGYVMTRGSTYANQANLAPVFYQTIIKRYEGTRLGRQEIYGELLEDVEGALWAREWIDRTRINLGEWFPLWRSQLGGVPLRLVDPPVPANLTLLPPDLKAPLPPAVDPALRAPLPDLVRMVVAVDPNTTSDPEADEAGIVVAALGADGRGYVFDDRSATVGPMEWGLTAVETYHSWMADKLVAERNNGGEMVLITIRQFDPARLVHTELVWASRGKVTRAEPVAALYQQGRVSHVGRFDQLEDQLCLQVPGASRSPGRLDALVWALTELFDLTITGPDQTDRTMIIF